MTKTPNVTIHQTAGQAGEQAAPVAGSTSTLPPGTVIDAQGRKIVVRQLHALDHYRLAKIMGEAGDSGWARQIAVTAVAVCEIDGEPEAFPNTEREVEALIQLLGSDGFEAANKAIAELHKSKPKPNPEAAKN